MTKKRRLWWGALTAGTSAMMLATPASGAPAVLTPTSPSTNVNPYVVPVAPGVKTSALLTVNDKPADNGYRMVGIPDGLGAFRRAGGDVVLNMNHELVGTAGIPRRHGQKGAFVSQLVIDQDSLRVEEGSDLIDPGVQYYNYATMGYGPTPPTGQPAAFSRFCSSTLTDPGQLMNERTGRGYQGQIYFANEESGAEGRSFGVTPEGTAQQLPRLGLFSWENTVPAPNRSDTTLVMGMDDSTPGEVYAYAGTKTNAGSPFDRAGLTNGANHGVRVDGVLDDATFRSLYAKGAAARFNLTEVNWNQTGAQQQAESTAKGVLKFGRPEDGHWDPNNRNDYYFVTTAGGKGTGTGGGGGLWRMRFDNVERPELGGSLTLLLDGSEGLQSPDNITIDRSGNLLIQEDPGNAPVVARILAYRIGGGQLATVAQFDPARFAPGAPNLLSMDEESSGIIDAHDLLGPGWFLFDAQVHTAAGLPPGTGPGTVEEYVENGQLLAMKVADFFPVYNAGQPPPVIPEVPLAAVIPVSALSLFGAAYVWRRRQSSGTFPGVTTSA